MRGEIPGECLCFCLHIDGHAVHVPAEDALAALVESSQPIIAENRTLKREAPTAGDDAPIWRPKFQVVPESKLPLLVDVLD